MRIFWITMILLQNQQKSHQWSNNLKSRKIAIDKIKNIRVLYILEFIEYLHQKKFCDQNSINEACFHFRWILAFCWWHQRNSNCPYIGSSTGGFQRSQVYEIGFFCSKKWSRQIDGMFMQELSAFQLTKKFAGKPSTVNGLTNELSCWKQSHQ